MDKGIIIKSDAKTIKLLVDLAKRLGAGIIKLTDDQLEDFVLGELMDKARKSGKVDREIVMKRLNDSI